MERPATLLIDEPGETALVPQSRPSWRKSKFLWAVVPVVVMIVLIWQFAGSGPPALTQKDVDRAVKSGIEKAREEALNTPPDAATAYRRILPSLVTIVTTSASTKTGGSDVV